MFDSTVTTLPASYCKITDNVTSNEVTATNHITVTTRSNESCKVVRHEITIIRSVPEPLPELSAEDMWAPEQHRLFLKPLRPVRLAPWQAKWRLKQQRPRDGLHS